MKEKIAKIIIDEFGEEYKEEYLEGLASQISALFNTEEIREKIANIIWGYPYLHTWLTLDDAKTYPKWKGQTEFCYTQASQILSLLFGQRQEKICPHCNGEGYHDSLPAPMFGEKVKCAYCNGTGSVTKKE